MRSDGAERDKQDVIRHPDKPETHSIKPSTTTVSEPVTQSRVKPELPPRKIYHNWRFVLNFLRVFDFVGLIAAGIVAYVLRFGTWSPTAGELMVLYFGAVATVFALQMAGSYRTRILSNMNAQLSALFVAGIGTVLILLIGGFITGSMNNYSRVWILGSVAIGSVVLVANRVATSLLAQQIIARGHLSERVVLVGVNDRAEKIISNLATMDLPDLKLIGLFDDRATRVAQSVGGYPLLGTVDDLLAYVRENRVDRVVVTLPWTAAERIRKLLGKLRTIPVRVDLAPHDIVWEFQSINVERLAGVPIITVANRRLDDQIGLLKRIEDIVLSILLLILTGPVMLLVALAIKLDSKGPIVFRQKRHGFNNEIFEVFKFRTMHPAPVLDPEVTQAIRNDPRVTRIGGILRRLSLDELPQFINVLQGTMSVVGPRPHAVQHNVQYAAVIEEYFARHNVKPGITGWAQINGLRGETDTDEKMRKRVEYDLHYIEHWSLLFDLRIVLMTAIVTLWPQENAY